MKTKPTKEIAIVINELLNHGLCHGLGKAEPGKMCVEAVVCYAMGMPHGDDPSCVSPIVRSFKIMLNDSNWSSNIARANGLRRLAIAQLGSEGIDNNIFVKELTLALVRKIIPIVLRAAASVNLNNANILSDHAIKCEKIVDLDAACAACAACAVSAVSAVSDAASAARTARAASYAACAACAASDAVSDAVSAASAACYAARAASYAACDAVCAARDASDEVLTTMAECAVGALIAAKSPGCEWLSIAK